MYTHDDIVHDVRYDHLCDSFWGESRVMTIRTR